MISKKLNEWLQVLGLFGVLGGLIFVGLQLNLDRQVAITQRITDSVANRHAWSELVNDNAEVWVKGLAGEALTAVEAARFDALASSLNGEYFSSFQGARDLAGEPADRIAWDFAADLRKHPGLLRWWEDFQRERMDQRRRLEQGQTSWQVIVDAELARLGVDVQGR